LNTEQPLPPEGSNDPILSSSPAETTTQSDTESVAELLSAEELADYEQLRGLVSPEKGLALLDDFAKWLFVIAAAVGTLGASFGVSNANDLTGSGRTLFAWAVALVGFSLALAALARLPLPIRVNRYSDVSLSRNVSRLVQVRGILLIVAALLFATGLVLAGLSPLLSDSKTPTRQHLRPALVQAQDSGGQAS
jgi:hypothetical protein